MLCILCTKTETKSLFGGLWYKICLEYFSKIIFLRKSEVKKQNYVWTIKWECYFDTTDCNNLPLHNEQFIEKFIWSTFYTLIVQDRTKCLTLDLFYFLYFLTKLKHCKTSRIMKKQ